MSNGSVIIVDDEREITSSYEIFLRRSGYTDYLIYNDPEAFLNDINTLNPAVVFMDLRMPKFSGEELLAKVNQLHPDCSVFIISGTDEVETAVRCIKEGALDYLVKPIDKDRFQTALLKGMEVFNIKNELNQMKRIISAACDDVNIHFRDMITNDKSMMNIFKYVEAVSSGLAPVMIIGETGTGKDLLAEAVHKCSGIKGEFLPVNVSALDENMFNDTLFGHVKGAFTGADKNRKGLLASAENGTVFLDEIGDLKESSQIKLLRLLQNQEYLPVGSDKPLKTNARIVAATNADLAKKVENGEFRQDLFYRLKTHMVSLPPLRNRGEDIELLTLHFFKKELAAIGKDETEPPSGLLLALKDYKFPGNVRELQSAVMDYVIQFADSRLNQTELRDFLKKHNMKLVKKVAATIENNFIYNGRFPTLKELESVLIESALSATQGNQSKAAKLLGITRQALNKRLSNH